MRSTDRDLRAPARAALRTIAVFEAAKGLAALAALLGWLSLMHHDVHRLALELIGHFGLEPQSHYPELLLRYVDALNVTPVRTTVLLGLAYTALRWLEAGGLWLDRAWGEWIGALGSGVYVPFELVHLRHSPTWQGAVVVCFNLALVLFLCWRLWQRRGQQTLAARSL
ncbi:MAG: DUF2127 domain-containing protein [Burkholderiaceae bacterium]|jgi:uncharacterized membrane protein (DUF2068 family)|nr:DUF2127 domain-containing protein [Burkholderiaceae bacterium]